VKTVSLVVIWGLFHGLVLLPAFLSAIPPRWLEMNLWTALTSYIIRRSTNQNVGEARRHLNEFNFPSKPPLIIKSERVDKSITQGKELEILMVATENTDGASSSSQ
jgi:hypothetical protein